MEKRSPDLPPLKLEPGKFYRAFDQSIWCCIKAPALSGRALCTRVADVPAACTTFIFTSDGMHALNRIEEERGHGYNPALTLMEEVAAHEH